LIVSEITAFICTIFEVCVRFLGVKVGVVNFLFGQSIGIDENNTFQLQLVFLLALEWAWHAAKTNLRCVRCSGIYMPSPNSLSSYTFQDLSVHPDGQTNGQTDMARSTRLVILIKNIYTLWDWKRFLLPVTYFPTNQVYPFTLQVTGRKGCKPN